MNRPAIRSLLWVSFWIVSLTTGTLGQVQPTWPPASPPRLDGEAVLRPEQWVLQALQANPITAPYGIRTAWKNGQLVLSGRVGTGQVHDAAVRTVIDLGIPLRDDLVIDTAEAHRVAMEQTLAEPSVNWGSLASSSPYFVYPPPLFGRVDDPFFGFEPPLVSFPPWAAGPALAGRGEPTAVNRTQSRQPPSGPVKGQLELTVDAAGQVFLRGLVASLKDKQIIENEARNTPGVTRVYSELQVAQPRSNTPPPPPRPYVPQTSEAPPASLPAQPAEKPPGSNPLADAERDEAGSEPPAAENREQVTARDGQVLSRRVATTLSRSPTLASLPIAVASQGDVVTLAGKVSSAYEAMLVYRGVERTPGVREIIDQLQFPVPDENHPNPLIQKARPEDLEPYLTYQIRRHLGDQAHVDRVRARGDLLEIRGTIESKDDLERIKAVLRSMPLLRDFRLDASFQPAQ